MAGVKWLDDDQLSIVADVEGGEEEMAQRRDTFEKMDGAQEVSALTGGSGRGELDGGKLRHDRPLFMLQTGVSSTTSTAVFGFRPRPAVRP